MANDQVSSSTAPQHQESHAQGAPPPLPHFAPQHNGHDHKHEHHNGHGQAHHQGHDSHQEHGGMQGRQPGGPAHYPGAPQEQGGLPHPGTMPQHDNVPASAYAGGAAHLGDRSKVPWGKEIWDRIDKGVHDEVMRTRIAAKFLPCQLVHARVTSVPAESVRRDTLDAVGTSTASATTGLQASKTLTIDEGATLRINEFWIEFALTPQQVEQERGDPHQLGHSTALTLATRAANYLAQAEDLIVFQGVNAFGTHFFNHNVRFRGAPADAGLLSYGTLNTAHPITSNLLHRDQVISVPVRPTQPPLWGEETFGAVAKGYSDLQRNGHYGPYALVLETKPYADSYAPLPTTLILTADRIKPLMDAGYFGSHTLNPGPETKYSDTQTKPQPAIPTGILVSLGGNTLDIVRGLEAAVTFVQTDPNGFWRFRVVERFALRIKDPTAIVRLEFNTK